jgi:hypothetical protein
MKRTADLTYETTGYFTVFYPETEDGHNAWNQIAKQTMGTGKVETIHLKSTLCQIRKAGYVVRKAKSVSSKQTDLELLQSLGLA